MSVDQAIADAVQKAFAEHMPSMVQIPPHEGIKPWRAYTIKEAVEITGIARSTLYDSTAIPKINVGEGRTGKRILGINLLCFLAGVEPPDLAGYIDGLVAARKHGTVRPIGKNRTRVI